MSGVRNSCDASVTNRRSLSSDACRASNALFNAFARCSTSPAAHLDPPVELTARDGVRGRGHVVERLQPDPHQPQADAGRGTSRLMPTPISSQCSRSTVASTSPRGESITATSDEFAIGSATTRYRTPAIVSSDHLVCPARAGCNSETGTLCTTPAAFENGGTNWRTTCPEAS